MQKVVFLDRDGTLNIDYGYVHSADKFKLLDGVEEALHILQGLGYKLIIVSNQSGIGRGYFSEDVYLEFQKYILDYFAGKGIKIEASYYCPHISKDNCDCRKPKTGLFERASCDIGIDWKKSIAIGDRYRDLTICKERNIKGFFIRGTEEEKTYDNIISVDSLLEAAHIIRDLQVLNM